MGDGLTGSGLMGLTQAGGANSSCHWCLANTPAWLARYFSRIAIKGVSRAGGGSFISSCSSAFNSGIFDEKFNLVYRIDRRSAKVSTAPLGRIYTGLTSLFQLDSQLLGIEMVDIDSCGEYCRGRMLKLPKPEG